MKFKVYYTKQNKLLLIIDNVKGIETVEQAETYCRTMYRLPARVKVSVEQF